MNTEQKKINNMNPKIEKKYFELIAKKDEKSKAKARRLVIDWYEKHPEECESDFEKILAENADLLKLMKDR